MSEAKGSTHAMHLLKPLTASLKLDAVKQIDGINTYETIDPRKYLDFSQREILKGGCPCEQQSKRQYNFVVVG